MLTLIRNGGVPVLFVVAFGLAGVLTALAQARHPRPEREGFIRGMMRATLFSTLCALAADLAAVMMYLKSLPPAQDASRLLFEGIGESMSPPILGFALLSVTAFLQAVAARRAAAA